MSWLSRFNPTPGFPAYSGPYSVGTVDVEVPAADLPSCSTTLPESAPSTIAFRIFYPCETSTVSRPVKWIPSPQRATVSAFATFLGANSKFSNAFSYLPSLLYHITIPASRNAPLLNPPTENKRWPVVFFSHGLAGSRNLYSHICGSIASHGLVVIAMDHRDGSSPIQYIRATRTTESKIIEPVHLSHTPSPEVYAGRDQQLRIRLLETALAHAALLKIDRGDQLENLDDNTSHNHKERVEVLDRFKNSLDVHEPGRISFAGHSFGACTIIQLLKSVFYAGEKPAYATRPLFEPLSECELSKQITAKTPVALLDLWCLPLRSPSQSWLWEKPLPSYASGGSGGHSVVSILSQGFFNWSGNCNDTKRAIAPPRNYIGPNPKPHCFYPVNSQHFSQSDFGILFPYVTRKFMKAQEPERVLTLNTRAVLQLLRDNGIEVALTSSVDREVEADDRSADNILLGDGAIRGWTSVDVEAGSTKEGINVEQDKSHARADDLGDGAKMEM